MKPSKKLASYLEEVACLQTYIMQVEALLPPQSMKTRPHPQFLPLVNKYKWQATINAMITKAKADIVRELEKRIDELTSGTVQDQG